MATDAGVFNWPATSGSGVPAFANLAAFPSAITSGNGALAIALDTNILYESNGTTWIVIAGPADMLSVGTIDSVAPSANGASDNNNQLIMQSASATFPGLVNLVAQTFAGAKTFNTAPILNSLTASLPLQLDASKNIISTAIDLSGTQATGILAAARFPALTGDLTTSAGALATTLATVNSNVGSFGSASSAVALTVNAKGLVTAASASAIQIAESQVTNLVSDLAGKQPTGNYITALTGDGSAAGPGSVALTLATVNSNVGSFGGASSVPSFTVNAKGLVTAASATAVIAPAGTLSGTTLNSTVVTSSLTALGVVSTGTWQATTIATGFGGTGVTSVTTAPAATAFAGWDANKNLSAVNHIEGYTTTATAAGTSALVVGSSFNQYFTGSSTQTVTMPVVSGLVAGMSYTITNLSSGNVTVQSSGANTIQVMIQNTQLLLTCISTSGTGTASWSWAYYPTASGLPLTNPMSTGGDIIYGGASGAPTRLANGTAGQVLQSAGGTAAPFWGNPINLQNFLVNGAFDYWQAGTSGTITATGGATPTNAYLYQSDQWYVRNILGGGTVEGIITYSQTTAVTNGSLFGAKAQITTAPTGTGIQNGCELWQTLSNKASLPLYGQTASFAVQIKSFGNVNQVGVQFFYATTEVKANAANAIGAEVLTTVNSSTFTTCAINGQALGTSQTSAGVIGVRIRITGVSSGNAYDLNNGFVAEQAILNLGTVAAPFSRQYSDPVQELMACRYFYYVPNYDTAVDTSISTEYAIGQCVSTTLASVHFQFPLKMRAPPTPAATNLSDLSLTASNGGQITITSFSTAGGFSTEFGRVNVGVASGIVAGNATVFLRQTNTTSVVSFDARL